MSESVYIPKFLDNPETGKEFASRAHWKYKRGDHQGAIEDYKRAIETIKQPNSAKEFADRADWKEECGDYQGAIKDYTRAIELETDLWKLPNLYLSRAMLKAEIEDHQGAIEDYNNLHMMEELAAPDGEAPPISRKIIYDNRASAKLAVGDYQGALDDLTLLFKLSSDPPASFYSARAEAKHGLGDKKGACQDWRKALEAMQKQKEDILSKTDGEHSRWDWAQIYEGGCEQIRSAIEEHCRES